MDQMTVAPVGDFDRESALRFGPFRLLIKRRLLYEGDYAVKLGSRALDILIALIKHRGDLVSKRDLMARVWPNMFVDEANLTVQVAALRRRLGDGKDGRRFVINIPGQGYRFVAPVVGGGTATQSLPHLAPTARGGVRVSTSWSPRNWPGCRQPHGRPPNISGGGDC